MTGLDTIPPPTTAIAILPSFPTAPTSAAGLKMPLAVNALNDIVHPKAYTSAPSLQVPEVYAGRATTDPPPAMRIFLDGIFQVLPAETHAGAARAEKKLGVLLEG